MVSLVHSVQISSKFRSGQPLDYLLPLTPTPTPTPTPTHTQQQKLAHKHEQTQTIKTANQNGIDRMSCDIPVVL